MSALNKIARTLVSNRRGILAADESIGTMSARLENVGVEPTAENRRVYRELIVTTPRLAESVSGVILADETFHQKLSNGRTFPEYLEDIGILAGIKVDTGAKPLAGAAEEKITEGLDGLRERVAEYVRLGATFAKWRAVITIGDNTPSSRAVRANLHALARYAGLCQEGGLVPIVEPEVLMDGAHSLDRCREVSTAVLRSLFEELALMEVELDGIVLKPNMVVAGTGSPEQPTVADVARATVETLRETVPASVPGIAFLSGGQRPEVATQHLGAMQHLDPLPWELTYSFGRALVGPALEVWRGDQDSWGAAQDALSEHAVANAAAR
ncbi:Fructose-bisphosphate aldolase class I [Pseudonocardia sp. Ae168_Ps1]|uniref:class I fructose-bisphosphate aldolase n=1 Tax=unclassified Pseudonocardia TaxID=2619320 RepID=UPI00094AFEEC|nr:MULTISPECIES: class I fructose-bisphosphate aldolase [unclassified Pseudonocardia]OLL71747.1 Fructose-bisphosphate aldolase class I [Pseudonocardia sp. Ae150A_Ps1]OLL77716.1 Fructose-bisphosphate aldolase class I [Pseudonocardia sp. Ae168_Ps1]OLL88161.1 Fructose-bisphosphate aldolase class I [Pseudonocardia sp. Ae263_Ps1]OLL91812.1 Fructose-bisphosphate aldolase class I [Pseudonocardia sp. Ae356_Ps1]